MTDAASTVDSTGAEYLNRGSTDGTEGGRRGRRGLTGGALEEMTTFGTGRVGCIGWISSVWSSVE